VKANMEASEDNKLSEEEVLGQVISALENMAIWYIADTIATLINRWGMYSYIW
jgi:hypothetical protein